VDVVFTVSEAEVVDWQFDEGANGSRGRTAVAGGK